MPPPPFLTEEIVEEILLRLPSTDPTSLVRAALVCRPWRCLVSSTSFRCRFREFHRTPPMLEINHAKVCAGRASCHACVRVLT
ncbi:unnamed protein product [Urochloa humidicola]